MSEVTSTNALVKDSTVQTLNSKLDTLNTTLGGNTNIAPVFNTATAYTKGDMVYYNNDLYVFTSNHSAGAWTGNDVVQTKVSTELSSLKSGLINMGSYSTKEVNTGMKWIDGRDIYRKVISCGALPNTSQKIESSGLSNVTIIDIHGVAFSASDAIPLPHAMSANKNAQLHYSNTIGSVVITTADDYSSYTNSYVYLLYVKNA